MTAHLTPALFALAALAPLGLCLLAAAFGGGWLWAALAAASALAVTMDRLAPMVASDAPEGAEFPAADALLVAVAAGQTLLMPVAVWAAAGPSGFGPGERVLMALAAGTWLGHVAHPAAHELIHRGDRRLFRLGEAAYALMLFGHHASAHRLVHHRWVATAEDPNSAPEGMGFWRFAPRAWAGSWRRGLAAERGRGRPHPYLGHAAIGAAGLALAALIAGAAGVAVWLLLAAHAQLQILLADYVQHYGLRRALMSDGRPEPVGPRHAWNSGHWFTGAQMLNAPRHSDHHAHPGRPYHALRLPEGAPVLPWPLPVACALAMAPRLWRRLMAPRLRALEAGAGGGGVAASGPEVSRCASLPRLP
jgi:alkane 1-monooxygenase